MFVRFRTRYPDIDARLDIAPSSTTERRLIDGELDLGFTEALSGTDELESEVFRYDELVAIVPPNHPFVRKRRLTAAQFCCEPFVVRDTGSETKSFVERVLVERGLSVAPVMSLPTSEAIKRAVAAGVGVAIVSRLSVELELKARRLAVVPIAGLSIRRPLYSIRRRPPASTAAVAAFQAMVT